MSNLRIIFDNAADRTSSITASATAGGFAAANMLNDYKGQHHRSTSTSVSYTLNWSSGVTIGGIVLPATNLTASATIAVTFTGGTGSNISAVPACPDTALSAWANTGVVRNANLFAYGGLSKTAVWLPDQRSGVTSLTITLTDSTNPAGYIDCSRIVCGPYWQPQYSVDRRGLNLTITDTSKTSRTDAGDLLTDRGFVHDELSFNLGVLTDADRATLSDNMRKYGINYSLAASVFPNLTNYVSTGSPRNSIIFAISNQTTWSDAVANNYFTTNYSGVKVLNDTITQYSTSFSETRFWDGSAWTNFTKQAQLFTIYGKRDNASIDYLFPGYSSTQMKITGW